jgi:N-acetyl sugar amidotransferase
MDSNDDPYISFDSFGICNHCAKYAEDEKNYVFKGDEGVRKMERIVQRMKLEGKGKAYDCIVGISGGVDSTFLALLARDLNLRVLGVHCDNGWNSELAVNNIENIVKKLKFDLYTYVINWDEFRDIQLAYFKANVIDIEAITDLAFRAVLLNTSSKYNIKYFLSGDNIATESVLPEAWICKDYANLINIHRLFGKIPMKTYPLIKKLKHAFQKRISPVFNVELLNLMDYRKDEVKLRIAKELEWRDYGGKHYESIFTRFYQGYILPNKFGVDKRKAHLSNLICSSQISRVQAIEALQEPIYQREMYLSDRKFVLKKLGFSDQEFDEYIQMLPIEHNKYGLAGTIYDSYPLFKIVRPLIGYFK